MGRWGRVGYWDSILVIECRIFLFSKEEQSAVWGKSYCCGLTGDVMQEKEQKCVKGSWVSGTVAFIKPYLGYFGYLNFLLFAPETKFEFWRVIKRLVANSSSKTNLKLFLLPGDIWLSIEGPCALNEIIAIVQRTKLILSKRPVVNRRINCLK